MRALYTSASGLSSFQTKLDVIANNVANVNTTGYKSENAQFAELLRSNFPQPDTFRLDGRLSDAGAATDLGLRIGNGSKPAFLEKVLTQGNIQATNNMYDVAIAGDGYFTVGTGNLAGGAYPSDQIRFTRAGKFQLDAAGTLVTDQGYPVLDANRQQIQIGAEYQGRTIGIGSNGEITVQGDAGSIPLGQRINVVYVRNAQSNLQNVGDNLFQNVNIANYDPFNPAISFAVDAGKIGTIQQGYLEMANVDLSQEMTELIQMQRAYQLNARSVQTVDSMMGMSNNLRA